MKTLQIFIFLTITMNFTFADELTNEIDLEQHVYGITWETAKNNFVKRFGKPSGNFSFADGKEGLLYGKRHVFFFKNNKLSGVYIHIDSISYDFGSSVKEHRTFANMKWKIKDIMTQDVSVAEKRQLLSQKGILYTVAGPHTMFRSKSKKATIHFNSTSLTIDSDGGLKKVVFAQGANTVNSGKTALIKACENGHIKIVKLLLSKDINLNTKNDAGTALIVASKNGFSKIVKLLLDKDANLNSNSKNNGTALIAASKKGFIDVVKLLLDKDANRNPKDSNRRTALGYAALKGHAKIVELLLSKGANLNPKDNKGHTPLMAASYKGHIAIVKLLLDKSVELNHKDTNGKTALGLATNMGHKNIAMFLKSKGAK